MRRLGEETKLRTEHSVGTWASAREASQALDDSSTATRRRVLSKDCELYSRGHLNALVRYSQDAMNRSRHAARLALFDSLSQPATQAPITTTTVPPLTTAELRSRRMSWIDRNRTSHVSQTERETSVTTASATVEVMRGVMQGASQSMLLDTATSVTLPQTESNTDEQSRYLAPMSDIATSGVLYESAGDPDEPTEYRALSLTELSQLASDQVGPQFHEDLDPRGTRRAALIDATYVSSEYEARSGYCVHDAS